MHRAFHAQVRSSSTPRTPKRKRRFNRRLHTIHTHTPPCRSIFSVSTQKLALQVPVLPTNFSQDLNQCSDYPPLPSMLPKGLLPRPPLSPAIAKRAVRNPLTPKPAHLHIAHHLSGQPAITTGTGGVRKHRRRRKDEKKRKKGSICHGRARELHISSYPRQHFSGRELCKQRVVFY